MSASAGRVMPLPKGEYSSETTYKILDMVRFGAGSFICKKTSLGNEPSFEGDTEYWQLMTQNGDVYGVKGNAETEYRSGNVNITPANVGAVDLTDYEEDIESLQRQLTDQTNVLGAKNLLENNETTRTIQGITFTVNSDKSITANGTKNTSSTLYLQLMNMMTLPSGKYILSGCPSGGNRSTYHQSIQIFNSDGTLNYTESDIGNGVEFSIQNGQKVSLFAPRFSANFTDPVNNLTFKPMLRLASDPDDTYVPYAMTNRELTEKKINLSDLKTVVSSSSDFAAFKTAIANL